MVRASKRRESPLIAPQLIFSVYQRGEVKGGRLDMLVEVKVDVHGILFHLDGFDIDCELRSYILEAEGSND